MELSGWTYEALPKTILYTAVLLIIGAAVTRSMLRAFIQSSAPMATISELDRALEYFGVVASSLAVAALLLRAIGHTATVFGAPDSLRWNNIRVIAIDSRWGKAWRLQLFAAGVLVLSALCIRIKPQVGWILYTIGAIGLCAMIPGLGHGATSNGRLVLHVLHLTAVSAWLGTLAVITSLYLRKWPDEVVSQIRYTLGILLQRFSKIALPAAGLAILTGIIAALIYVESFSNLLTTSYGQTLLLKIGAFAGVFSCGWSNWRRLRTSEPTRPQTLIAELVFAFAVIVVTGILTETEHP